MLQPHQQSRRSIFAFGGHPQKGNPSAGPSPRFKVFAILSDHRSLPIRLEPIKHRSPTSLVSEFAQERSQTVEVPQQLGRKMPILVNYFAGDEVLCELSV